MAILTLACTIGCGKNSIPQQKEEFQRFASSFHVRLQRQYFEPRLAPDGVVIKLTDQPQVHLSDGKGTVTFTQSEASDQTDRDVRITLVMQRQAKNWEIVSASALVVAEAKHGKAKQPVAQSPTDALANEVYGSRIRNALAAVPTL